jgi:hypothetical protein
MPAVDYPSRVVATPASRRSVPSAWERQRSSHDSVLGISKCRQPQLRLRSWRAAWPPRLRALAARPHGIRLQPGSYELLLREAQRRGVEPDALADELLRADLGDKPADLEGSLVGLAEMRARLPQIDGAGLARVARDDLERRSA